MGGHNLDAPGVVGCQPVGGGFSERARSQSGIDPSSVASGVPGCHHAPNMLVTPSLYTLTQSVMLSR